MLDVCENTGTRNLGNRERERDRVGSSAAGDEGSSLVVSGMLVAGELTPAAQDWRDEIVLPPVGGGWSLLGVSGACIVHSPMIE